MATILSNVGAAGNFTAGTSWVGGVAPTAADDAVLQATTTSMTIDTGAVCRSLTDTAFTGTLTHTAGVTLTIGDATAGAGNVALAFGSFTYTLGDVATSAISFISTSATVQTVNFNGKTTGNVTFNAASNGSWQYTAGHTCGATATVTLTKGTLDVNGQTCSWGLFLSAVSNVRTLSLGGANITVTGTGTPWNLDQSNLAFSSGSATLTLTGTSASISPKPTGSTGTGWESTSTISITGAGNHSVFTTGSTLGIFTVTGTANKADTLIFAGSWTFAGAFTVAGNSTINRIIVKATTIGTSITLTSNVSNTISNIDFQDVVGAGSASWNFSARTDIGDCGGNTGITFPVSVTQTATGTASFTWSTHGWTSRVPLPQDDVVINNAFIAGRTITADMPRLGRSIDFTGCTGTPALSNSASSTIFGSITLISAMTMTGSSGITFGGRGSFTVTSAGQVWGGMVTFNAPGGAYSLNDALANNSASLALINGTFTTNNFNITVGQCNDGTTATRVINLGTSIITFTRVVAGTFWSIPNAGTTLNASNATFVVSTASVNTRTFGDVVTGRVYGTLTYTVAGSTGELDILGSNTFNTINFSDASNARSLKFTAATTTTITNKFNVFGLSSQLMTVTSITGAAFTMTASLDQSSSDYLNLTNSVVDASPKWYAGANSVDNGGNTNWIFSAAPVGGEGIGSGYPVSLFDMLFN